MASIRARKNKHGEITSYQIRVFKGYGTDRKELKPYTAAFKPDPSKTERQNLKDLNKFAVEFEEKCKKGLVADANQTFAEYAEYVMTLKKNIGTKHRTLVRYAELIKTINIFIGYMKLADIRPQHLNNMYDALLKDGNGNAITRAKFKTDFKDHLRKKKLAQAELSRRSGVPASTISALAKGQSICAENAEKISTALECNVKELFSISKESRGLSPKTVLEHHRLVSAVMSIAEKEMLILYNPARRASPPKVASKEPNYFQIDDVLKIRECLERIPLKWKVITHLLLITGCRRGEIAGLKWETVDWENHQLYICRTLLYSPDIGVYEETPKTRSGYRYIALPTETMQLLKEYKQYYDNMSIKWADRWHDTGYLFVQEKAENAGKPINPDGITAYLNDFSEKYDLPHINPHAFRHTQASLLYYGGMDSVSISKRLGHSKVSTTTDLYAHIIRQADERNAECIADTVLRSNRIEISRKENRA